MNETDRDLVFSKSVKAGKRIYYFDVKQSRNGDKYIAITESKKIIDETPTGPKFSFEKHKLFLYKEDYEKFTHTLSNVIAVAKGELSPADLEAEEASAQTDGSEKEEGGLSENELNINLDF